MSAKAGKRPLRSLTAHEKLDAIRRVHDGESKASVARDIGVPESTLRGWCKNEDKISYLSRQSTPETDDSTEPKEKRSRLEETSSQPFNLSVKSNGGVYSPTDVRYATDMLPKMGEAPDVPKKTSENGHHHHHSHHQHQTPKASQQTTPSMLERERNRAELARLSIELGLNRPEMFVPTINSALGNLAPSLTANLNLMNHPWSGNGNNLLTPTTTTKKSHHDVTPPASSKTDIKEHNKTDKNQSSVDDSVWYWLQTQQAMLGLAGTAPSATDPNSSWFWKWYKQFAYAQQQPDPKPILYQQLTKDKDGGNTENLKSSSVTEDKQPLPKNNNNNNNNSQNTKVRAVLDNLLLNNNNNVAVNKKDNAAAARLVDGGNDVDALSQSEALEHGEKFLRWLEHCSEPSVTAMQILQFRYLLSNIKNGADRKNGEQKTKVKRK